MTYYQRKYRLMAEAGEGDGSGGGGNDGGSHDDNGQAELIAEARADGWKPEEEYTGKGQWVDAETFVKRGREINPILKKHNDKLMQEIRTLKAAVDSSQMSVKALQEHNAKIEENAYKRAIADLKTQRRTAMVQGDLETAVTIEDEIESLEKEKPAPKAKEEAASAPKVDPALTEWVEENKSWYNDQNTEMLDYANVVGIRLRRQDPENLVTGKPFLEKILAAVKKQFPEKFGSKRKEGSPVEGGGGGGGTRSPSGNGGTRMADLPADARAAFKDLAKEDWYIDLAKSQKLTPEQLYIKDYRP
jgi:hypothetical protein